jgi:hypothetical protein
MKSSIFKAFSLILMLSLFSTPTLSAANFGSGGGTGAGGGAHSWKYTEIMCWDDISGRWVAVAQCDAANGTCDEQGCGC